MRNEQLTLLLHGFEASGYGAVILQLQTEFTKMFKYLRLKKS